MRNRVECFAKSSKITSTICESFLALAHEWKVSNNCDRQVRTLFHETKLLAYEDLMIRPEVYNRLPDNLLADFTCN